MQILGPSPNGKYVNGTTLDLFSLENRSGSNLSGSGKYSGSMCSALMLIITDVPFSTTKSASGTLYSFPHLRFRNGSGGYFLRDSEMEQIYLICAFV